MINKWFMHWMKHSMLISKMSTCPRGKVGAFIIDNSNNPISAGFNGPPRKAPGLLCAVDHCARDSNNIKSGSSIEIGCHHAEMNAIYNAAENGVSLKDSTIYVIGLPICHDCAKGLIQAGISRVVTPEQEIPENWQESISSSISMFKEAGVIWDWIKL